MLCSSNRGSTPYILPIRCPRSVQRCLDACCDCLFLSGHYNLPSLPPPWILPNWEPKHPRQEKPEPLGRVGSFDLNILNLNVWGLGLANRKNERMPAIAEMLMQSDYDVVLVQEAWYNADYRILARTFPHVTFYGTPGTCQKAVIRQSIDQSEILKDRLNQCVPSLSSKGSINISCRKSCMPKNTQHREVFHPTHCYRLPWSYDNEQVQLASNNVENFLWNN